jgi:hypothetical protein
MTKQTHKTVTILDKMTPSDKERFWSKVNVGGENECWLWKDRPNADGYGTISIGGRDNQSKLFAHRVAKTLATGEEIPPGKILIHGCDNPPCCNPEHLHVATHQENMDDMVQKKRSAVNFSNAKVNWDIVDDIRSSNLTNSDLSQKHKVSESTIYAIKTNRSWKEEHRSIAPLPN